MAKGNADGKGPVPIPRSFEIRIGKADVRLIGCVKGLMSESSMVKEAVEGMVPDLIGLHIGKEELRGLEAVIDGEVTETELSSYEKIYALRLSRFGEVQIPPPSLIQAMRSAREMGITVEPLDMDDRDYSELYAAEISGLAMMRQSLRLRKVSKVKFEEGDPASFCLHWDRVVNRLGGFKRLERERERRMAGRIRKLAGKGGRQLHITELERMTGIASFLSVRENTSDKVK